MSGDRVSNVDEFVRVYDEVTSTQDVVRSWFEDTTFLSTAKKGPENKGGVVKTAVAHSQTKGKGRNSHDWVTPPKSSLMFSTLIAFSPEFEEDLKLIPFSVAVSVQGVLKEHWTESELNFQYKWPNDLMLNKKKYAGIICEFLGEKDGFLWVSVGIGINLLQKDGEFPDDCKTKPTSLRLELGEKFFDNLPRDYFTLVHRIVDDILQSFERDFFNKQLKNHQEYQTKLNHAFKETMIKDCPVSVTLVGGEVVEGVCQGIDDDFSLLLSVSESNELRKITVGEVQLL
jgi:BirA family biotin operon repressor/biotin-[acetyl-CoA-carboxylase] ligase